MMSWTVRYLFCWIVFPFGDRYIEVAGKVNIVVNSNRENDHCRSLNMRIIFFFARWWRSFVKMKNKWPMIKQSGNEKKNWCFSYVVHIDVGEHFQFDIRLWIISHKTI
jgi:hypothetical protein